MAFSPDGQRLAITDWSPRGKSAVKVWDLVADTERTLVPSDQHPGCYCLTFHPDCRTLMVGNDRATTQWDVVTGADRGALAVHDPKKTYTGSDYVAALAFSPDGSTLAAVHGAEDGGVVRLWNVIRMT